MGRRGPPKKPTELKLVQGNPGKTALPKNEPKPQKLSKPKAAKYLSKPGRKIWREMSAKLAPLGLLTVVDTARLARYCDKLARFNELAGLLNNGTPRYVQAVNKGGFTYRTRSAELVEYLALDIALRADEREFGLTPSARAGLGVVPHRPAGDGEMSALKMKLYGKR